MPAYRARCRLSGFTLTVPCAGWVVIVTDEGIMVAPDGSVSLARTSIVTGVSSSVVTVSGLAMGGCGRECSPSQCWTRRRASWLNRVRE